MHTLICLHIDSRNVAAVSFVVNVRCRTRELGSELCIYFLRLLNKRFVWVVFLLILFLFIFSFLPSNSVLRLYYLHYFRYSFLTFRCVLLLKLSVLRHKKNLQHFFFLFFFDEMFCKMQFSFSQTHTHTHARIYIYTHTHSLR